VSGAAAAQTTSYPDTTAATPAPGTADTTTTTSMAPATPASGTMPATGTVVAPDNSNPRRDARGIKVISDPAVVQPGWNGTEGTGMGGPLLDPNTGQPIDTAASYPPCTRMKTDKCLQTYERHLR
jgi:hypothetical protein